MPRLPSRRRGSKGRIDRAAFRYGTRNALMRTLSILAICLCVPFVGACASGRRGGPPVDVSACPQAMRGPFVQTVIGPHPAPTRGGFIEDGVYDLVTYVADGIDNRPGHGSEGLRWEVRFQTDPNLSDGQHQEGRVMTIIGHTPQMQCEIGRFATFGTTLRIVDRKGPNDAQYSVIADGFLIDSPRGGTFDPKVLIFRRRR